MEKYDVYSKFDIIKHKLNYVDYLEVIIDEYGEIHYAVPSHQEFLIKYYCEKHNMTRDELNKICPHEYYFNFLFWLCSISKCVSVWNDSIIFDKNQLTSRQIASLTALHHHKLYRGEIPQLSIEMFEKEIKQNEEN